MLVRDFMTTDVTTLQDTDSLLDARMVFVRSSFRHIPVLHGRQIVGIVTEHDIRQHSPSLLTGVVQEEYNRVLETTPITRAMTKEPVSVTPEQPVFEAAQLLYSRRFGCLPVVEDGELVGIVTTSDMLRLLVQIIHSRGPAARA
ncbi:MAG: CBS domain-containing protein [Acidobacteria bacterium]|nr:CBS domain-containing protein [Acidobacteriota bacterium]